MKKINILALNATMDAAFAFLRTLGARKDLKLYFADSVLFAPMKVSSFCSGYFRVPEFHKAEYIPELVQIIKIKNIDVLLPIGEYEVKKIAQNRKIFDDLGVSVPIADWENIKLATDKLLLQEHVKKHNIKYPKTIFLKEDTLQNVKELMFPVIFKQRSGTGQRGMKFFNTLYDFYTAINENTIHTFEKSVVQEFIPGWDHKYMYTVGLLFGNRGNCIANVPLKKIRAQKFTGGTCTASYAVDEDDVKDFALSVAGSFHNWVGIMDVEIKRDPRSNELVLIEINPRPWGAMYGTIMAGVNFPELWLQVALGKNNFEKISYEQNKSSAFFARDMQLLLELIINLFKKKKRREALSVLKTFKYPYLEKNRNYCIYNKTSDFVLTDIKPLIFNIMRQVYRK